MKYNNWNKIMKKINRPSTVYEVKKSLGFERKTNEEMNVTPQEYVLADRLRKEQIDFEQQVKVDHNLFDFRIKDQKILLEVNGSIHNRFDKHTRDIQKSNFVQSNGWCILTIENWETVNKGRMDKFISTIRTAMKTYSVSIPWYKRLWRKLF